MRIEKNGPRYFSFDEVAKEVFGLSPVEKTVRNESKKKEYQDKFTKSHMCKTCKRHLVYMGGNVMCCTNPECTAKIGYQLLDEKSKSFAQFIYGESEVGV